MTKAELEALAISKKVDARGTACPGPLLEAKRAIAECAVGGAMEVFSSDEGTKSDISRWCGKMQHEYLGDIEADGYWRIFLRRKK
jgi:tRNA 2-thiouridine synthesizing protein A